MALLLLAWLLAAPAAPAPVVFIHGIEGSTLVDAAGDTQWLDVTTALRLRTRDLRLPLTVVQGSQGRDDLRADDVLRDVSLIRGLIGQEVYGPFLDGMQRAGHKVHAFAYDWRRDNLETVALFEQFIADVRAAHGGAPVQLIAHSMGGLIGLIALNHHPEAFRCAVFAGVPFRGGIGFLADLHAGLRIGLNEQVLAPEVMFTFPSVYGFFPLDGAGLLSADGTPLPMNFFDASQWRAMGLGVFASGRHSDRLPTPDDAERFLRWALPRARAFREQLVAAAVLYPPVLAVTSKAHPTLMKLVRQGPNSELGWDFTSAPQEPGDGRVAFAYSLPYPGIPHTVRLSEAIHSQLLNDPQVLQALDTFLSGPAQAE